MKTCTNGRESDTNVSISAIASFHPLSSALSLSVPPVAIERALGPLTFARTDPADPQSGHHREDVRPMAVKVARMRPSDYRRRFNLSVTIFNYCQKWRFSGSGVESAPVSEAR